MSLYRAAHRVLGLLTASTCVAGPSVVTTSTRHFGSFLAPVPFEINVSDVERRTCAVSNADGGTTQDWVTLSTISVDRGAICVVSVDGQQGRLGDSAVYGGHLTGNSSAITSLIVLCHIEPPMLRWLKQERLNASSPWSARKVEDDRDLSVSVGTVCIGPVRLNLPNLTVETIFEESRIYGSHAVSHTACLSAARRTESVGRV